MTVLVSPTGVATAPDVGGHFWVYMQYVQGLRNLGHEVFWLERIPAGAAGMSVPLRNLRERLSPHGLDDHIILYDSITLEFAGFESSQAERIMRTAELLLNFDYEADPRILGQVKQTALIDIDPGLLQFWLDTGQITMPAHNSYFTIGETVGRSDGRIPAAGLKWVQIRPPVSLDLWPYSYTPDAETFTTVSSWWGGGGKGEWITDGADLFFENNKRVTFLDFAELPLKTDATLELALFLGEGDPPGTLDDTAPKWKRTTPTDATDYTGDQEDMRVMLDRGWRIRHSRQVAGSPGQYRSYIQQSRGEFSCAKPSCMWFQNAWISDRTICYLASGKPAIVQDTGPSEYLPDGLGLLRFSSIDEAVQALGEVGGDYLRHSRAAREIAEQFFDAEVTVAKLLDDALR